MSAVNKFKEHMIIYQYNVHDAGEREGRGREEGEGEDEWEFLSVDKRQIFVHFAGPYTPEINSQA